MTFSGAHIRETSRYLIMNTPEKREGDATAYMPIYEYRPCMFERRNWKEQAHAKVTIEKVTSNHGMITKETAPQLPATNKTKQYTRSNRD